MFDQKKAKNKILSNPTSLLIDDLTNNCCCWLTGLVSNNPSLLHFHVEQIV